MKRFFSQKIFCSPDRILRNTVLEQNDENLTTRFISLDEENHETSQTIFYNGIISSEIISVKIRNLNIDTNKLNSDYQYIDINEDFAEISIIKSTKPLIIDFGTENILAINNILKNKYQVLSSLSLIEVIAGCTYNPNKLLNLSNGIMLNNKTNLICWDSLNKQNEQFKHFFNVIKL